MSKTGRLWKNEIFPMDRLSCNSLNFSEPSFLQEYDAARPSNQMVNQPIYYDQSQYKVDRLRDQATDLQVKKQSDVLAKLTPLGTGKCRSSC